MFELSTVSTSQMRPLIRLAVLAAVIAVGGKTTLAEVDGDQMPAKTPQPPDTKWAFIICGHPGDDEHRELFAESVESIRSALTSRFGFPSDNVWLRFGVDNEESDGLDANRGPATFEALSADAKELKHLLRPEDELWVVVIGHAHADERVTQLNLPGPDVSTDQFGRWFADIDCRRSVFFVTTPLSGGFLKPLAKPNRAVISATDADVEVYETLYHLSLAKLLGSFPADASHDVDGDQTYSLRDLYLLITQDVGARYAEEDLILTEHAQIDDNGDGRGTELQVDYEPWNESSTIQANRIQRRRAGSDGEFSRSIEIGSMVHEQ